MSVANGSPGDFDPEDEEHQGSTLSPFLFITINNSSYVKEMMMMMMIVLYSVAIYLIS